MMWFKNKPSKKEIEKTIANSRKSSEKAKLSIDRFLKSLEDLEEAIKDDNPPVSGRDS